MLPVWHRRFYEAPKKRFENVVTMAFKLQAPKKRLFGARSVHFVADKLVVERMQSFASLFRMLIQTLPSCRFESQETVSLTINSSEIVSVLSFYPSFVPNLWKFLAVVGSKGEMAVFLDAAVNPGLLGATRVFV
jgi:hypothetical protein